MNSLDKESTWDPDWQWHTTRNIVLEEEVIITVDSTNLQFSPSEVTITDGVTVRFFWEGELLAHNAVEKNGIFDSGDPERDVDYSFKFEVGTNGTYDFVCEPHESANMVGKIIVSPIIVTEEEEKKEEEKKKGKKRRRREAPRGPSGERGRDHARRAPHGPLPSSSFALSKVPVLFVLLKGPLLDGGKRAGGALSYLSLN